METEHENLHNTEDGGNNFPISKLFPSIVTLVGLAIGLSAVRAALNQKWEMALFLVVIAAFLDGVDGRLARFLNASSKFGANLDSLADIVNFGIVPSMILYLWELHNVRLYGFGWGITLLFTICCAIRLARFNAELEKEVDDDHKKLKDGFFKGVPVPAAAILAITPMMVAIKFNLDIFANTPELLSIYVIAIALLMPSRLPTYSLKNVRIKKEHTYFMLTIFSVLLISLVLEPWRVIPVLSLIYLLFIPISFMHYHKIKAKIENQIKK